MAYKKQLRDKDGNVVYPDVGLNLDDVVYSDDPGEVVEGIIDPSSYSLDEKWTGGYWVDGRKIYKKTLECENVPVGEKDYNHGVSNMGLVIKYEGFCKIDDTTTLQVPTIATSTSNSFCVWTTYSTHIKVFSTLAMDMFYCTIYYVKTS